MTPYKGVFSIVGVQKNGWSAIASAIAVAEKAEAFLLPLFKPF